MIRRLSRWLTLLCVLPILAGAAVAQSESIAAETLTEAQLQPLAAEALTAVGKATGFELAGKVPVRIASPDEVAEILAEEFVPQFIVQGLDEETAREQSRVQAQIFSDMLLAKYAFSTKEILVLPDRLATFSKVLGLDDLNSREGLLVMLVHEAVHAADDMRFNMDELLATADSTDTLLARNALVEGHAQFVARKVSAKLGLADVFAMCTEMFGAVPDHVDESMKFILQAQVAVYASAYHDGEKFFDALHAHGGEEAIAGAFAEPPSEMELILHPEWYLDPAKRPTADYDLQAGLEAAAKHYGEGWQPIYQSVTTAQLKLAMSMLPKERVAAGLDPLRANRVLTLSPKKFGLDEQVVVALYEFGNVADAQAFVQLENDLLREKDELMQTGMIKIVSAAYDKIDVDSFRGVYAFKIVEVNGTDVVVSTAAASRGRIAVEYVHSGKQVSADKVAQLGQLVLDGVTPKAAK